MACKECALNMVEYGAGGNITYGNESAGGGVNVTEEGTGGVVAGNGGSEGNGNGGATVSASAITPAALSRRKRKAKGWFCPVCRERELYNFFS